MTTKMWNSRHWTPLSGLQDFESCYPGYGRHRKVARKYHQFVKAGHGSHGRGNGVLQAKWTARRAAEVASSLRHCSGRSEWQAVAASRAVCSLCSHSARILTFRMLIHTGGSRTTIYLSECSRLFCLGVIKARDRLPGSSIAVCVTVVATLVWSSLAIGAIQQCTEDSSSYPGLDLER